MPNEQGSVELGFLGKVTTPGAGAHLLRPKCTYVNPKTNARCLMPAHYEFELNPENWPGAKPPIIQYACQGHGAGMRTLVGVLRINTL